MEGKKYDCKKCGKSFEMNADDKAPECVHCGSKDVKPAAKKADAAPCCGPAAASPENERRNGGAIPLFKRSIRRTYEQGSALERRRFQE